MNKNICIAEFRILKDRTLPYIEVIFEGAAKVYFRAVEEFYYKCCDYNKTLEDYSGIQCMGAGIFRRNVEEPNYKAFLMVHPDEVLLKDALELLSDKQKLQKDIKYLQMWLSKLVKSDLQETRDNLPEILCNLVPELRCIPRTKEFLVPEKEKRSYSIALEMISFYLGLKLAT